MRSIALDRDLADPEALTTYLITPAAVAALRQIGSALAEKRSQRAWKIVGPYGSGKSALGLLVAHLLSGPKRHKALFERLSNANADVEALFRPGGNRFPLAVVGSRTSLGDALARQISKATQGWKGAKALRALHKRIDLNAGRYDGQQLSSAVSEMLSDFSAAAIEQGYAGVTLLIDEMGKFIEHAALYPNDGDLIALQNIAEMSCRHDDRSLVVIAMLHQHFSDYAHGVGRALDEEWHKVAARFEEIPFDEPIERYVHFAAHALGVDAAIASDKGIVKAARRLYGEAQEMGALRLSARSDREVLKHPEKLYPLHPLAIATLAVTAKRYGQSERSFHAFLRGYEPFGFRDFAQRQSMSGGKWLSLPEVFDFLAAGHGLHFRDLSMERRWSFAVEVALRRNEWTAAQKAVFKCIAVLELAYPTLRLAAASAVVGFALVDEVSPADVKGALAQLVESGVVLYRRQGDEYVLAVSDAVNIDAEYTAASTRSDSELLVFGVRRMASERRVIANRHYDSTGVIRTMSICIGTLDAWPVAGPTQTDGRLDVVLVDQGVDEQKKIATKRVRDSSDRLCLTCVLPLTPLAKSALVELSKWAIVQENVSRKRLDLWTTRYVDARLAECREDVERLVLSEVLSDGTGAEATLWHLGEAVPAGKHMNLSQAASWLFDKVYPDCPRVVNELINKERPTPAIVLARQRLLELVLAGSSTTPLFKRDDFPPERLIAASLLRDSGLLSENKNGWAIHEPAKNAKLDIRKVWARIGELLRNKGRVTFSQAVEALGESPLGLRAGVAGVWVVMYVLTRRSSCAVFERNSFVLELTVDHFARMFKNPGTFELKEMPHNAGHTRLLHEYAHALAGVGYEPKDALTYVEVARALYRWVARLSTYSAQTNSISGQAKTLLTTLRRATDPIALLSAELPAHHKNSKSKQSFGEWLSAILVEISMTQRKLHEEVTRLLAEAFSLTGSIRQIRSQLQQDCSEAVGDLADPRLKSFLLRCTDLALTDDKWLDSVVTLLVQRPLDAWDDQTTGRFKQSLVELSGHYKRWLKLVKQSGRNRKAGERYMGVTMTLPGGNESSVFVPSSPKARALAKTIVSMAERKVGPDRHLLLAALAQALVDLEPESSDENEKHDKRAAS